MSRKLKLQMQISVDGFVSTGPNDDQSWVTRAWEEIKEDVLALLDSCDTHIIGRKLAVDYIPYWQQTFTKTEDPMFEVAKRIVAFEKIVFSTTIKKSVWDKTEIMSGNLSDKINNLKNEDGKDIFVVGGTSFVSSLIKERLIDEFYFYINPVALSKGESIYGGINNSLQLILKNSKQYKSGINLCVYERKTI